MGRKGWGREKKGWGKKGRNGKEGVGRGGGIFAIGFSGIHAPVQKHRLIAKEIIFVVPPVPPGPESGGGAIFIVSPVPPGSQKWGDNVPPHPLVAPPMVLER